MPYIIGPRAKILECRTQNECRVNAPLIKLHLQNYDTNSENGTAITRLITTHKINNMQDVILSYVNFFSSLTMCIGHRHYV